jgi:hypothetical protein
MIPMMILAKHLFADLREIITPTIHAQNHALAIYKYDVQWNQPMADMCW